jgi:ribosomal protein L11 methyltransferase
MSFTVLKVVANNSEISEILQAELSAVGFDVFLETENGFETSIEKENFDSEAISNVLETYKSIGDWSYSFIDVEKQNWNEVWELNFEPIVIANKCLVRAEFHTIPEKYEYELVITPKMSFGTGHHATTSLMIEHLLENDLKDKSIADCGSGTGILAIMAMKLGAKSAIACDIETWAVENTVENGNSNGVIVTAIQGTAQNLVESLPNFSPFDVVIANIQLNVLLEEMEIYEKMVAEKGLLFLSGILAENLNLLVNKAESCNFILKTVKEKTNWAALCLQKI